MSALSTLPRALMAALTLAQARMSREEHAMLAEMRRLQSQLPPRYQALSLPEFLSWLTPKQADWAHRDAEQVRRLADATAFLDRRSPFGLCLRRALLRYHFLRRAGVSLGIVFAMRLRQADEPPGLAGHVWNSLHGRPYHERAEDMAGFTEVYRWPEEMT